MSQRSRPGSAQSLADQQRMPFAAAEALHWGKKTHDEHKFIHSRMYELEEHHRAYNARIEATEAVAEAAEAATARIRHIEQQVAAIESEEQDRPFDKWVQGEVQAFKMFVEKNKTVRQKQIELETKISGLEDSVDKAKDVAVDLEILMERVTRLEGDRIKDANFIEKLEGEVTGLKVAHQTRDMDVPKPRPTSLGRVTPKHMRPPLSAQPATTVEDVGEETEDEEILPTQTIIRSKWEQVQMPLSSKPISKSTSTIFPSSPKEKGHDDMSARLRVMQRKSIHDPKYTHEDDPWMGQAPTTRVNPPVRPQPAPLPATQVVERPNAKKPMDVDVNISSSTYHPPSKQLIVKLPTRKRKFEAVVPSPRVTRSQAKKINNTINIKNRVPNPKKVAPTMETQLDNGPAAKRRKPNTARPPPQPHPKAKETKKPVQTLQNVADTVKILPRKAAPLNKRSKPVTNTAQQPTDMSSGPRKKRVADAKAFASPTKYDGGSDAYPQNHGSSSSMAPTPSRPAPASTSYVQHGGPYITPSVGDRATSTSMGPPSSRNGSVAASRGSWRPPLTSPVTLDLATYERMKNQPNMII